MAGQKRCGYHRAVHASTSFRIPIASDVHGRLVPPEEAAKGARYSCPSCEGDVDLHAGERKRRHFHHRASTCNEETVLHVAAKRLVVQAVHAWREGGPAVAFVRRCAEDRCEETATQRLPKKVLRAVEEHRTPSGYVVDVALLGPADLAVAAIEVVVTHEVDARKAFELGLPWIEVAAADVCASRGLVLTPLRDRFLPWLCDAHTARRGESAKEERAERKTRTHLLRRIGYRLEDYPGFRIERTTRCPNGHDALVFAWDTREPPWPRPPHVVACETESDVVFDATASRARRVLPFRRTWASACPTCDARVR